MSTIRLDELSLEGVSGLNTQRMVCDGLIRDRRRWVTRLDAVKVSPEGDQQKQQAADDNQDFLGHFYRPSKKFACHW